MHNGPKSSDAAMEESIAQARHAALVRSDYLHLVLNPQFLEGTVACAVDLLANLEFDAIAFRGMSGALLAPILGWKLSKTLILVRKPEDSSHSCYKVEGDLAARRYVIVDDFVASGHTVSTIISSIRERSRAAECIGVYTYSKKLFRTLEELQPFFYALRENQTNERTDPPTPEHPPSVSNSLRYITKYFGGPFKRIAAKDAVV